MKKKRYWWLLPLLCAAALIPIFLRGSFPRLEVAGFRIGEQEYLQAMYRARNEVLSDHAAQGISLRDWDRETPLGDPRELTVQRALEILAEYYAVSTLAVERGYLADAGYDAMLRELEQTNRQRKEALASGTIITGIPSFTVEDFLAYRASSLRLEFTNDPDQPENQVTEEEIRLRYEADRDALYRQPDSVELCFLDDPWIPGHRRCIRADRCAGADSSRPPTGPSDRCTGGFPPAAGILSGNFHPAGKLRLL